ncbi:hypothetical protein N6H14_18295 [Paenibacillus sp. CC-CFT747]|nr:hypothetical protein N6H14_18295 [Paenibacillus sp. CC-CFT747]
MSVAVFTAGPLQGPALPHKQVFALTELEAMELTGFQAVFLIGSPKLDEESSLTRETIHRLWHYVRQGGVLYAEMIQAFDFAGSRLFGWKQDFPKTRRTMEKLRVTEAGGPAGSLLEWDGAMAYGFPIHAEVLLEHGVFKETHKAERAQGERVYPALLVRSLGEGTSVYSAFSLFGSTEPAAFRPNGVWKEVLTALSARTGVSFGEPEPVIRPSGGTDPDEAVKAVMRWFLDSGILPERDGSAGVHENVHSVTARLMADRRPDCHAHTALFFYLYGKALGEKAWEEAAHGLLQSLFEGGYQDMEPDSATYGFFKWYDFPEEKPDQIFTDDNAWAAFVLLYLYRQTGREEYRVRGLAVTEAMLATQRPDGLRANMLLGDVLRKEGRESAVQLDASWNPHFESIAHAAFVQAYRVTGEQVYLDTAVKGTITLVENADKLAFMYSRTSGLGRFLLPLSYLSSYDSTGTIREGLRKVTEELFSRQHASGAIEEADNPDPERFGQEDAGVYLYNGEGIADQLYTNNFLLMNAWEAWKATGDSAYKVKYEELREFLCRIQIASGDARFNGGWMRAFDLNRWEYFGNNGDTGWGPYCMESGWTQAMIGTGLLLGLLDESVFE